MSYLIQIILPEEISKLFTEMAIFRVPELHRSEKVCGMNCQSFEFERQSFSVHLFRLIVFILKLRKAYAHFVLKCQCCQLRR